MVQGEAQLNWEITPIESSSGNSFLGRARNKQVFIKLNANPLLPSLSTEGIAPKIEWIKNTDNGDTLTAQSWIEGRTLKPQEMVNPEVAKLLNKLHSSRSLRDSLSNFDRSVKRPGNVLNELMRTEDSPIGHNHFLSQVAEEMLNKVPALNNLNIVVVHGDLNASNFLLEEASGRLYLIDWETVSLGDAFYDLAYVVSHFIMPRDWGPWLSQCGYSLNDISIVSKIQWYGQLSFFRLADQFLREGNIIAANNEIQGLRRFMGYF